MIHPTAVVDESANIDDSAVIGPYAIVGPEVKIGARSIIDAHVVIKGPTVIGEDNHIHQFASIGDAPQDHRFKQSDPTSLVIGDRNSIREYVSIHRAIVAEDNETRIGNDNMLMAYAHIGHNCIIGNNVVIVNCANLAGHVKVDDYAIVSGFVAVYQFCRIGACCMVGIQSKVTQDIPPYVLYAESKPRSINAVGLKRRGFSPTEVQNIRRAFKTIYRKGYSAEDMLAELDAQAADSEGVSRMRDFIRASTRGIAR